MEKEKKIPQFIEITKALFNDKNYINNLTLESARQNIFMILRRLAIQYPLQANIFNDYKANPLDIIKFWSEYLYNGKAAPGWMYTSGAAKSKEKNNPLKNITLQEIRMYKDFKGMSDKDFDDYVRFFPEYIAQEVKSYSDLFKD